MLVRFCVLRPDPYSRYSQGVFHAASELRNAGRLEPHEEAWLKRDLDWFREYLPVPPCLRRPGNDRAICWFKPDAHAAIDRVRGIVALLDSRGVAVRMVTTAAPGLVLYEDCWQVAAKPCRRSAVHHRRTGRFA